MTAAKRRRRQEDAKRRQLLRETQTQSKESNGENQKMPDPPPVPTTKQPEEKKPCEQVKKDTCSCEPGKVTSLAADPTKAEWQRRWMTTTPDDACLFTRGDPATPKEFYQLYWFNELCEAIGDDFAGPFLEMGAGRATTSMYLSQHTAAITLVDQCQECFSIARSNFQAHGLPSPRMIVADARQTGEPSESQAAVYSIGLLEHMEDAGAAIAETYRLLKPGGTMFHVVVEIDGDGQRYKRGKDFYIKAATTAGFVDAQAVEELRKGIFILTARK